MSSDKIKELLAEAEVELVKSKEELQRKKNEFLEVSKSFELSNYDPSRMKDFLSSPYAIVPKGNDEWYVIIPRFIDIQVGWLEKQTPGFNIFRVNRYVDWIAPVPESIREALDFEPKPKATIQGEYLLTTPEDQDAVFKKYSKFVRMREGNDKIRIRQRASFNLIASLVKDGILPFTPKPIDKIDLVERPCKIQLRDYQKEALDKFLQFGNIGVFWMPSAGKTFLTLWIMNMLKGRKLIVVPSLTLVEQWESRIKELTHIPSSEYRIITYSSAHKVLKEEFTLAVFDECHHLPANIFSKLSLIKTRYRLGLSATPYREDGRNELIFALTGFPVGLDWKHLMELKVVTKPRVKLIITRNPTSKIAVLDDIIRSSSNKKTIVFCDRINLGKQLANRYNVHFVHGQTKKRLARIAHAPLVILSRVGDEGVSLQQLQQVIEFDFLFGSRRQELQRLGRLFHSNFSGDHLIMMTEMEYDKYKKRLYSIYEKGIDIAIEQR